MARPKEFDTAEVLDHAMLLFWKKGYEATSIEDLIEATGIKRGSIYGSFTDKEGLFLAVLERYSATLVRSLIAELNDPDPRRAIERLFESILRRKNTQKLPLGCLMTNTLLECRRSGGDRVTRTIKQSLSELELAIYAVLCRAKAEGLLTAACDAKALAHFYFGVVQALNVMSKADINPEVRRNTVKIALDAWYRDQGRAQSRSAALKGSV
jgi:TetR/AcrR family transcriptional regulator, transcriptional repressor for nem operon